MSSGPARYDVSGDRRKPKPSCSTSSVPSPKIDSPFLAWCLRSAKTSSCLRRRLAPSSSLAIAMSTSSVTCFSLRSERCIPEEVLGEVGEQPGKTARAGDYGKWKKGSGLAASCYWGRCGIFSAGAADGGRANSQGEFRVSGSDVAVNESRKLRLG